MKMRFIAAVLAAFFMLPALSVAAHGDDEYCPADDAPVLASYVESSKEDSPQEQQGLIDITPRTEAPSAIVTVTDNIESENTEQPTPAEEPPTQELPTQEPDVGRLPSGSEQNPFTPSGTGEVVDNATESDGKEFFTITTPDENTFYLVIDRQRTGENVYLLNAVTEADLLSLAKMPEQSAQAPAVTEPASAPAEPETEPPAPEKSGGAGMMIVVVLVVVVGGGAGYYFKIYRPKQQGADSGEDFDGEDYDSDEPDPYGGDQDADVDYGGADWDAVDYEPDGGRLPDEDGGDGDK